ncbi:MAG: P-II family nitrogen regulator [Gemmatimonadetes bacterium]|nr:P-II family nitrogen regulator [Gemmatimonadota bacterium]
MSPSSTKLLVAVINDAEKLDEILSGFLEIGVTGATIVSSEGMGRLLSDDIPIFAGLQAFLAGSRPQNRVIFSVVPAALVDPALALLQEVCGNLGSPATGIAFVLPVERVVGLAPELGDRENPTNL